VLVVAAFVLIGGGAAVLFLRWHLGLSLEALAELAAEQLLGPTGPTRKRTSPDPGRVVPSPGLRNCHVSLSGTGRNQVSSGSMEGRPGHFLAIAGHGDRVTITLSCPTGGSAEPSPHRTERSASIDRFHWDETPTHASTRLGLRWTHPRGDQDEVTLHWQVRR
jgi:hypothetical protein